MAKKSKTVTLSTRFASFEHDAIQAACNDLGWSASKLIHDATMDLANRTTESGIGNRIDALFLANCRPSPSQPA